MAEPFCEVHSVQDAAERRVLSRSGYIQGAKRGAEHFGNCGPTLGNQRWPSISTIGGICQLGARARARAGRVGLGIAGIGNDIIGARRFLFE